MPKLSDYLKSIGLELHDRGYVDDEGTTRPITKDEQLAREVWRRALGHEQEIENTDGSVSHRVFPPDPKAQAFIFERREGKVIIPLDDGGATLLDKIAELTKSKLNKVAEEAASDRDTPETDA